MEVIYSETERKCRAVVETIPDGVYEADNYIDAPGAKEPIVHIHVKVTVSGSDMTIDFTGTSAQTSGNNNSRTLAAAYIAYKGLTTPLEPANEGSFRALKAIVPEGCIMMAQISRRRWRIGRARFRVRSTRCSRRLRRRFPTAFRPATSAT